MSLTRSLGAVLLTAFAVGAFAQTDQTTRVKVVVDGSRLRFRDEQPIIQNDRVLVPLRGIFERLGAHVGWDPSTQTVSAHRGGRTVQLVIGQDDASVDGRDIHLDVPAQLVGGSTMVPLRFVSESLGATVHWNDQENQADISTAGMSNPRPPDDRTPPVIVRPPVVVRPPVESRPMRQAGTVVIAADSIVPMTLQTRLSSEDARPGDPFTATIDTYGRGRYMGIPEGSTISGVVAYAKPHRRATPGILELTFDRITTPNGRSFPVDGRLIGLHSGDVIRQSDGTLIARGSSRNDHVVFAGYGAGAGLVVGLAAHRPLEDAAIGGLLGLAIDSGTRRQRTQAVVLSPGTQFGVRLYHSVVLPEGVR